ncbi:bacillithiol biosynthesis cysteine-adding enzyme BshC [Pararcticibacter amylolyticus]|uniref:Putative cysteine ligase BshC n=1 Tax=Pararcticibacter amylolyticus TaxID=2173175 RepID=A0A2U2PE88_9SPHI|nr:bacillithiol biosynthesis cysteine-adding enzyme BshC [Pararcticibacter amylolyticus]PWG79624.1 bacillithiol biosynthesis cysteine-adding enzyme BshC [Pararcticibacter amylolyticus]
MKATYIDYSETHSFSSTVLSYVSRDPKLRPFIYDFPTIEAFGRLAAEKKIIADRRVLHDTLLQQYTEGGVNLHKEQTAQSGFNTTGENIRLLSDPSTFTITTGHQLNIFTGPLYFIYKIVTAINLSRQLKEAYPDKNFVPVYWMASEDHDFAEINHTHLHGKKVSWEQDTSGATGKIPTDTIRETVKLYRNLLGLSENSEELSSFIEDAYLGHTNLADATRSLVHALFRRYGLVIVDADSPALKKQFAAIITEDILQKNSAALTAQRSKEIEEAGFNTQIHSREINFFYMKDTIRERIVEEQGVYRVLNTDIRFTADELRGEIESHPEYFSPNVVLRPLYQEIILPNLAYIGGGAEVVYWLQLKANFDFYNVDFPLLILRNSALITDESFGSKLCRLRIPLKDIFKDTGTIQKEWILRNSGHTLSLADEKNEFQAVFEKIKLKAYKIDPTLGPSTEAVNARLQKALGNLEKKLIKAEKRNHDGALSQIENLRRKHFPGEGLQERSENFGLFYIKYGKDFIGELIKYFKPLDFKFTILEP